MSTLHFTKWLDRDGLEQEVQVTALVEDYADAYGVPSEYRSACAGRKHIEIAEVEFEGPSLTNTELEQLIDAAYDRLTYS
jgi:hypothetical protein